MNTEYFHNAHCRIIHPYFSTDKASLVYFHALMHLSQSLLAPSAMRPQFDAAKHNGKVYTPKSVVSIMLDSLFAEDLRNIKICDPACGTGDFLVPVVEEICRRLRAAPKQDTDSYYATLASITGYDIDGEALDMCKHRLIEITKKQLGQEFSEASWRLKHDDAMNSYLTDQGKFDWVVGNPPYVRIQNLEQRRRMKIKNSGWSFFRGASDLYIVFFELGLRLLKKSGELLFISPSGWLRNDSGKSMREAIHAHHGIVALYDFQDRQLFPGKSTYTCITHLRKSISTLPSSVHRWTGFQLEQKFTLDQRSSIWSICPIEQVDDACKVSKRLKDIAKIQVGIQTLADRIYILRVMRYSGNFVVCAFENQEITLEKSVVKRILKASVLRNGNDKFDRIAIYPYDKGGKLIEEDTMKTEYPRTFQWLLHHKQTLLNRDKGTFNPQKWYAYGREVGITSSFGEKLLTSGLNQKPNFQICEDPDTLFYSGYCVKPTVKISLIQLRDLLNSSKMDEHIKRVSQPFRSGWFSYAKRYIQEFPVSQGH